MKLHHLRNMVAVVEGGSLRAAAKRLGLAPPAISRSIKELEQELGVVLFERNKFGMVLTTAGDVFVRRARGIQIEMQRTLDEIEQFKGTDRGTITIACSGATLLAIMPTIAGRFHHRFPNVRLKLLEGTFPMFETNVRDGLIDLYYGPVAKGFTDPALVIDPLFKTGRIVVGRRDHPLRDARSMSELAGASWLTTPVMIDSDDDVNAAFESAGLPRPRIVMQASSGMGIATVVAASDLLALVPRQWLDVLKVTNLLARFPLADVPDAPQICAVRRANMPLTPAADFVNDLATRAVSMHGRDG